MIINELIFVAHTALVSIGSVAFARFGKEALIAYISLLFIVANIFVIKQIELFHFCVTSADAFIVGISFSCNILQEFWGKKWAQRAIWISFASCIMYFLITQTVLSYIPAQQDTVHESLCFICANTMRLILASFIAYLITQSIDIQLYGFIKKLTHDKYFVMRNYFSLFFSQLVDTILFSYLGLWGIVAEIYDVMIMSFLVKLLAIFLISPVLMITKRYLSLNSP